MLSHRPSCRPTSTTATPHHEAVQTRLRSLRAPEDARIINPESLNQAPPRAISFIRIRRNPSPTALFTTALRSSGASNNPHILPHHPIPTSSTRRLKPALQTTNLMRLKLHPAPFLGHPDAHSFRCAVFADHRIGTFHQPPSC